MGYFFYVELFECADDELASPKSDLFGRYPEQPKPHKRVKRAKRTVDRYVDPILAELISGKRDARATDGDFVDNGRPRKRVQSPDVRPTDDGGGTGIDTAAEAAEDLRAKRNVFGRTPGDHDDPVRSRNTRPIITAVTDNEAAYSSDTYADWGGFSVFLSVSIAAVVRVQT